MDLKTIYGNNIQFDLSITKTIKTLSQNHEYDYIWYYKIPDGVGTGTHRGW